MKWPAVSLWLKHKHMSNQKITAEHLQELSSYAITAKSLHCRRCHRALRNKKSQAQGYGAVCLRKLNAEMLESSGDYLTPFHGDVVLSRMEGGIKCMNVPHAIIKHSPTGMEWGYGGSGPADLALNILMMFAGQDFAQEHYQQFKWDVVAGVPQEGGTIPGIRIVEWINARLATSPGGPAAELIRANLQMMLNF